MQAVLWSKFGTEVLELPEEWLIIQHWTVKEPGPGISGDMISGHRLMQDKEVKVAAHPAFFWTCRLLSGVSSPLETVLLPHRQPQGVLACF